MKKIYSYLALSTLLLAGCKEEDFGNNPVAIPGDDVVFSASFTDNNNTRTIYGDFTGTTRKVMWVNGDVISVFSPQCESGFQNSDYTVKVTANQVFADELQKTGEAGLRWGSTAAADTKFFATYPTSTLTANGENADAAMHIDDVQETVLESAQSTEGSETVTTWRPKADQPIPNNIMYAQPITGLNQVTTENGKTVANLQFNPYSTVLHITLDGWNLSNPELASTITDITIFSVKLTAPTSANNIAGNFGMTLMADGTTPKVANATGGSKTVTLNLNQQAADGILNGVSLKANEKLECDLFLIPNANTITSDWTVELETSSGNFRRNLSFTPNQNGNTVLAPGQIHKMELPAISINNGWVYQKESWLADINDNVYFTEVSLPGAWYAYDGMNQRRGTGIIQYGGNEGYQVEGVTVQDLFNAGIRAFQLETRMGYQSAVPGGANYSYPVISGTGRNQSGSYVSAIPVTTFIDALVESFPETSSEFAVLCINYTDGTSAGTSTAYKQRWLSQLQAELRSYTRIYSEPMTPQTPVSKLRGKIVVLINVDSNDENTNVTTWPNALFAYTDMSWEATSLNSSLISPMTWASWPGIGENVAIGTVGQNPTSMYLNYTLANRTWNGTGSQPSGMASLANRKSAITSLIGNSDKVYASKTHNAWYLIGAGGTYASDRSGDSDTNGPQNIAKDLNPFLVEQVNNKINQGKASPMGLVFINQCTNATYNGPEIVEAIIRMNRRFNLLEIGTNLPPTEDPAKQDVEVKSFKEGYGSGNGNGGDVWTQY